MARKSTKRKKTATRKRAKAKRRLVPSLLTAARNLGMTVPEFKNYIKIAGGRPNPGKFRSRSRGYIHGFD